MTQIVLKVVVSAVLIVAISEVAKRTSFVGALLGSLPLTSLLAMIWLYVDTGDTAKVAGLASGIFWLVLPSLALFLAFPVLLRAGYGFWQGLGIASGATVVLYAAEIWALDFFGIRL
jgi:hypothetical protein